MPYTNLNGEAQMSQREKQAKYDQETLLRHMASNIREGRDVNASRKNVSSYQSGEKGSNTLVLIACLAFLFFVNPLLCLLVILPYAWARLNKARKAGKPRRDAERAALKQEREDKAKGVTRDMFGSIVTEETEAGQKERTEAFGSFR